MAGDWLTFEKYAVVALLCTPSSLNRVWTEIEYPMTPEKLREIKTKVNARLDGLGLSDTGRANAEELMLNILFTKRALFHSVAEILKAETYSGNEPHPPDEEAERLVAKVRELDAEYSASQP